MKEINYEKGREVVGGALALPVLFAAGAVVLKKKKSDQ